MFEFIRTHTRLLFFFLIVLIIPSFVFFGIEGYSSFREGANETVAEVAGEPVTQAEWDAAHRANVERVRRQMPDIDAALLETPEFKRETLESLVRDRVLYAAANRQRLVTPDARMLRRFRSDPQFAFLRKPDGSVNAEMLAVQGMSSEQFAERLRQDLSIAQVIGGVSGTAFAPAAAASAAFDALLEQREVQLLRFDARQLAKSVAPTDAELQAYHAAHTARFQAPESADIEYLVLDLDALAKGVKLGDEELRKHYEQNAARYATPEERRASHILIKADKQAPAAEREKAKQKAEALLAQLKLNPGAFAELARKHSEDPGSAANGGDLDFFGRGAMVKPFEDTAFSLQPGAVSGVVESDFGYHIIKLTAVRGGQKRSFEAVRAELEAEVRRELAQKKFAELAPEFGNTVYEQAESLKPAADRFGLTVQTAQNLTRAAPADAAGPLASAKFREALFAPESLRSKRNTDAVEVAPNQLVSGRIVRYSPARPLPLAEVRDAVRQAVVDEQAAALAKREGEARLEALKKAPQTVLAEPKLVVSRPKANELPRKLVEAILAAPTDALPAHIGIDLGAEGYAVARVLRVAGREPADASEVRSQYARAWADAESKAYYAALQQRHDVEIKEAPAAAASSAASAPAR